MEVALVDSAIGFMGIVVTAHEVSLRTAQRNAGSAGGGVRVADTFVQYNCQLEDRSEPWHFRIQ